MNAELQGMPPHPGPHLRLWYLRHLGARGLVVEADGGSRGNPGSVGSGALVHDALANHGR